MPNDTETVTGEVVSSYEYDGESLAIGMAIATDQFEATVKEDMTGYGEEPGTYKLVRVDE